MRDEDFEWDERKAASNWRNHGVTFEIARQTFDAPLALDEPNDADDDDDEDRWQLIGSTLVGRLLFVV